MDSSVQMAQFIPDLPKPRVLSFYYWSFLSGSEKFWFWWEKTNFWDDTLFQAKNRGNYVIETLDRRGGSLHFRMTLIQVDHRILVDFRLSRGDGLEFKKHFGKIKTNCKEVIEPGKALPKNNRDGFTSHQSNWICGAKFKHHISEYSIWPFFRSDLVASRGFARCHPWSSTVNKTSNWKADRVCWEQERIFW